MTVWHKWPSYGEAEKGCDTEIRLMQVRLIGLSRIFGNPAQECSHVM